MLAKACVLAALLPANDNAEADVAIFEQLMAMDRVGFGRRIALSKSTKLKPSAVALAMLEHGTPAADLARYFAVPGGAALITAAEAGKLRWARHVTPEDKAPLYAEALQALPFEKWLDFADRAEQVDQTKLYAPIWPEVNKQLKTSASSIPELVEQLGIARFGRRPVVGDAFCGGGSIPFEAARLGCDVVASDLNPIACMLTWGALNIVGADEATREKIEAAQKAVAEAVDTEIAALGIEHNEHSDRAKAYLYCLETRCPQTGYMVPMLPSRIISRSRRTIATLIPDSLTKRFDILVEADVSDEAMAAAETGTIESGELVVTLEGDIFRTPIKTIRGDRREANSENTNALRRWEKSDFVPRADDIFHERLYAIQWITEATLGASRQETYFAAVTAADLARERKVEALVRENLADWQARGLVPDTVIESGAKTDEPIRTRGWTHWHHLFGARQLYLLALYGRLARKCEGAVEAGTLGIMLARALNNNGRLCRWLPASLDGSGKPLHGDQIKDVFYNQALNTLLNWGERGSVYQNDEEPAYSPLPGTAARIHTTQASRLNDGADYWITDPPYADAVRYEEITEFFIAWLRRNPPEPFKDWLWDSRRALAIKGSGPEFCAEMIAAYQNLAAHMPDNGMQIVMFTHQNAEVWADMAAIMWGAGLQVTAAWYVATETTSELKKGGYVQGTVLLVLRKRADGKSGYGDEISLEIKVEVAQQIRSLTGLNDTAVAHGRSENLFEDADLQMAGYAAALRVLTGYTMIDGEDMATYAARPRVRGRKDIVAEMISFAVDSANAELVPREFPRTTWAGLGAEERFYLKMVDLEAAGLKKLDNYQNFAKAFRVASDYTRLMASTQPNAARLKTSLDLGKGHFDDKFGASPTRAILWAMLNLQKDDADGKHVLEELRASVTSYFDRRDNLKAIARYLATQRQGAEAVAARTLANLIENERLG